jgi:hypothetical protein
MDFETVQWVVVGLAVLAVGALGRWVIRSFRRWPATKSEGRSIIWSRRGGGDM